VLNKRGERIASALTNLDLHDMARAAKTYGAGAFYVVTPLVDQMAMGERIVAHWVSGPGAVYNPARKEAMECIRVKTDLDAVIRDIQDRCGRPVRTLATSARHHERCVGVSDLRYMLEAGEPCLLCFGTAWGLAPEFMAIMDHVLSPITGGTAYNHLSVRSAASIILDRLFGDRSIN